MATVPSIPIGLVDQSLQNYIRNGQGYIATTGLVGGPGSTNQTVAYSFFVPNTNAKNILLFSLQAVGGSGTLNRMKTQTADPAFANSIIPSPLKIGGASSTLTNITYANTNQSSSTGTEWQPIGIPANDMRECLASPVLIPPSTAWGLIAYMFLAGANSNWGISARWVEY